MIKAINLTKAYRDGVEVVALDNVSVEIQQGEYVSIMGRSGAGKSTLLYQLSLLDTPTSGTIVIEGNDVSDLNETKRTRFRLNNLGYVFQDYALLPELTAIENVVLINLMQGKQKKEAYAQACDALTQVGLGERFNHRPSELSGGEQQRVSIARAIAHNPKILFADEPTANLDTGSAENIMDIFDQLHANGQTIVMISHEKEVAMKAQRLLIMEDGKIIKEKKMQKRAVKTARKKIRGGETKGRKLVCE